MSRPHDPTQFRAEERPMKLTPEQISSLDTRQKMRNLHPYTCGCVHHSVMLATEDGLKCPLCGRIQTNIHPGDLDGTTVEHFGGRK